MMMMVLVSKQHKVTTKYKMQTKNAFLPYLLVGRRHYHTKMQGKQVFLQGKWIFKSLALQDEQLWKQFLRPEVCFRKFLGILNSIRTRKQICIYKLSTLFSLICFALSFLSLFYKFKRFLAHDKLLLKELYSQKK